MPLKPKFRPRITRVKLNPEQAVLQCNCHTGAIWVTTQQASLWASRLIPDVTGTCHSYDVSKQMYNYSGSSAVWCYAGSISMLPIASS